MNKEPDFESPHESDIQEEALRLLAKYGDDAEQVAEDLSGTYFEDDPGAAFWKAVAAAIRRHEGDRSTE